MYEGSHIRRLNFFDAHAKAESLFLCPAFLSIHDMYGKVLEGCEIRSVTRDNFAKVLCDLHASPRQRHNAYSVFHSAEILFDVAVPIAFCPDRQV